MDASLATRLERDDRRVTVTALPDGSVDHVYEVLDGDARVRRREEFAEAVADGRTAGFTLRARAVEPGGHASNIALQADALGEDVSLVGHLDDPVFDSLSFETISMGDPARVAVHQFDDGDVLTTEPSVDLRRWSFDDLRAVAGDALGDLLAADVVFWTNWTTVDALPDALAELAALDVDGGLLLFDPGAAPGRSDEAVRDLFETLADLSGAYDVVLAANGDETRSLAGALDGGDADDLGGALAALRAAGDLTGAVVHEADAAVAATPAGRVRVENYDVDPVRHTGGGDRFDAGLAAALVRDWAWEDALTLGNACASHYVETGETGRAGELADLLRERS